MIIFNLKYVYALITRNKIGKLINYCKSNTNNFSIKNYYDIFYMCLGLEKVVVCEYMIKFMYENGMLNVNKFPFNNSKTKKINTEKYDISTQHLCKSLETMKFAQYYELRQYKKLFNQGHRYSFGKLNPQSIKYIFSNEIIIHELVYNKNIISYNKILCVNNDISSVITPKHINIYYKQFMSNIYYLFGETNNFDTVKFFISDFITNLFYKNKYINNHIYYRAKNNDGTYKTILDYIVQDEKYIKKYFNLICFNGLINGGTLSCVSSKTIKKLFPDKDSEYYNKYQYQQNEYNSIKNNFLTRVNLQTFKKLIENNVHINYPSLFIVDRYINKDLIRYILKTPELKNHFIDINRLSLYTIRVLEELYGKIF